MLKLIVVQYFQIYIKAFWVFVSNSSDLNKSKVSVFDSVFLAVKVCALDRASTTILHARFSQPHSCGELLSTATFVFCHRFCRKVYVWSTMETRRSWVNGTYQIQTFERIGLAFYSLVAKGNLNTEVRPFAAFKITLLSLSQTNCFFPRKNQKCPAIVLRSRWSHLEGLKKNNVFTSII